MSKVRIKVLSAFTLPGGKVAEPGTIVDVDPLVAHDLPASKAELLDPLRAKRLIDTAAQTANAEALAIERRGQPRVTASSAWVLPSRQGYMPHVH